MENALRLFDEGMLGWTLLGLSVLLLGLSVLVLARLRWIQNRPIATCVVLSVVAHAILFASVCMTRWFDTPPMPGDNSIRIRLSNATPEASPTPLPPLEERPWDRLAVEEVPVPSMTPLPTTEPPKPPQQPAKPTQDWRHSEKRLRPSAPAVVQSQSAPDKSPAPLPTPSPVPPRPRELSTPPLERVAEAASGLNPQTALSDDNHFELDAAEPRTNAAPASELVSEPELAERVDELPDDSAWEPVNQIADRNKNSQKPVLARPVEHVPQRYQSRMAENKSEVVRRRGGSDNTEAAVSDALRWLAKHQHKTGRWDASDHGAGKGQLVDGRFRGTAGMKADTGITGLALLALLGDGNTHQQGKYKREVAKGLEFLMRQQRADGNLCGEATNYARMYCHGIASLALAEAFAMSGDLRLKPFVEKAVSYSLSCQNPVTGGWRYNPGDAGDMSQMGWQLMFLTSAEEGGVRIPDYVKVGMQRFLQSVSVGANNGLASYRPGQGVTPSMTAEALVCRIFLDASNSRLESEAAEFIGRELPGYGRPNLYYWYYATLALSQTNSAVWEHWNSALKHQLLMTQQQRGDNRGSWTSETVWGGHGGRVYSTALAAMCLEVYYRYPLRNREVANRP